MMPPSNGLPEGYKQNPNPPQIRFIRKNGRIIPIVNKKRVPAAGEHIQMRLGEMGNEVKKASSEGMSFKQHHDGSTKYSKAFSNYPDFYRQLKFKNKDDFKRAFEGKTSKSDDLIKQAHEDISGGYESANGYRVPPDLTYKVQTRQVFNNNGVVFRKLNGRVVPLRIKASKPKKIEINHDDVPF